MSPITLNASAFAAPPEIRHTCVVKNDGIDHGNAEAPQGAPASQDGRTRQSVSRLLLESGPSTAASIAEELGLSPAAVRRHLNVLIADGEVTSRNAPRRGHRGRGRPARQFLLTESGRARFGHAYDSLAVSALRFLAESGGDGAVRAFAQRRVASMVHGGSVFDGGLQDRTADLADVLTEQGYAASAEHVGSGAQLCQHHCPVAHVAAEFPQLCEAETEAFAELLGTHVQRLATIARGDAACTTHVPAPTPLQSDRNATQQSHNPDDNRRGRLGHDGAPRSGGANPASPYDGGESS